MNDQDWQLFKSKIGGWQVDYLTRLNAEYVALLTGDQKPEEKFWQLARKIKTDQKKAGVSVRLQKSMLVQTLTTLVEEDVIQLADLAEFSPPVQERVTNFVQNM